MIEFWDDSWPAAFEATCSPQTEANSEDPQSGDVMTMPNGDTLSVGFGGASWPLKEDFFVEKRFVRRDGDTATYRAEVLVVAGRYHRDNHEYRIDVSRDGGSSWEPGESVAVGEYLPEGHIITRTVEILPNDAALAVRVVVPDTNDWQPDGSRIARTQVSFTRATEE